MKRIISVLFCVLALSLNVFAGPKKFDPEAAKNIDKFAKSVLKTNLKKIKKLGIKKLAILECYGEYVTSKEVTASAAEQRSAARSAASRGQMFYTVRTKTSTIELDKDFYTNTSTRVYEAVKEAFEENGIEIVPIKTIAETESYKRFNMEEEKKGRGVTAGMYKPTVVEKSQKVSVPGLGIFPTSPLKRIKLVMNLGEITNEIGAEGFLQISFKVDKGKKSKPVLNKFDVLMSADLRSQEVGFKGKKKMRYDFHTQWLPIVNLKKPMITQEHVLEGKKGPLDVKKYDKALMDILYAVTDGTKACIKKTLSK